MIKLFKYRDKKFRFPEFLQLKWKFSLNSQIDKGDEKLYDLI